MGTTGLSPRSAPDRRLVTRFFGTAIGSLWLAALLLVVEARYFVTARFDALPVIAWVHLVTLGTIVMVVMGVMYQLMPVLHGRSLKKPSWAAGVHATFVLGLVTMLGSLAGGKLPVLIAGASLAAAALLFFVGHIAAGVRGGTGGKLPLPALAAVTALGWLVGVLIYGVLLAIRLSGVPIPLVNVPAHIALAVTGFLAIAFLGISYQLLPMFLLSDQRAGRLGIWVYGLENGAAVVLFVAALARSPLLAATGFVLALGALGVFLSDLVRFLGRRRKKAIDPAMWYPLGGLIWWAGVLLYGLLACLSLVPVTPGVLAAVGVATLLGFLVQAIMGYLYRIIPFIVWLDLFRQRIGAERLPETGELYYTTWVHPTQALYNVGLLGIVAGVTGAGVPVFEGAAALFWISITLFAVNLGVTLGIRPGNVLLVRGSAKEGGTYSDRPRSR